MIALESYIIKFEITSAKIDEDKRKGSEKPSVKQNI